MQILYPKDMNCNSVLETQTYFSMRRDGKQLTMENADRCTSPGDSYKLAVRPGGSMNPCNVLKVTLR